MEVCILKQIFSVFNPPPPQFSQLLFRIYVIICLLVPSSLLPWNPSVFLAVSCTWSNMTRAREPIHFHLVIYRRFDLPQCSSISIRGGLLAGKTSHVCMCDAHACVCLCVVWGWAIPYHTVPFFLQPVTHLSTLKPLSWWGSEEHRQFTSTMTITVPWRWEMADYNSQSQMWHFW